jgi:flagellar hook protein FlgE
MSAVDAVSARIDAVTADARRAASPGSIGDAQERPGQIVGSQIRDGVHPVTAPSASPLSVAIDGPGWFIFDDRGRTVYGRRGDFHIDSSGMLVDGSGRAVMGSGIGPVDAGGRALEQIQVTSQPVAQGRTIGVRIDERGTIFVGDGKQQQAVARIAIAVFPAAERLQRSSDTTVTATPESGRPVIARPGDVNTGTLLTHALDVGMVDLQGDLAALWRLSRKGDLASAAASAVDGCTRTALGLVK